MNFPVNTETDIEIVLVGGTKKQIKNCRYISPYANERINDDERPVSKDVNTGYE